MTAQYVPILLVFAFAATVAFTVIGLSFLLGRGRLQPLRKRETYESGVPLLESARKRVPVQFFVVAMMFILFDVEVAFLYPWAISVRPLVAEGHKVVVADGLIFLVLLGIGYVYLWRQGAFDWSRKRSAS